MNPKTMTTKTYNVAVIGYGMSAKGIPSDPLLYLQS